MDTDERIGDGLFVCCRKLPVIPVSKLLIVCWSDDRTEDHLHPDNYVVEGVNFVERASKKAHLNARGERQDEVDFNG
jgi:hypothetical protein